jgi:all-trans-retinol dehydrogenase (NAD+)
VRQGGRAHFYHVDVSDYNRVLTAAEKVREEVGNADILINNAGTCKVQPFTEMTAPEIKKSIAVNLVSHFWTIKAFLPQMLHQGKGHIVAISSNLGIMGKSHFIDYSAAKFGVNGLMQALEAELHEMKKRSIRMTTICPAAIDTGLVKSIETRFPRIFPLLSTQTAAQLIVDAILRNDHLLIIPTGYRYLYAFLANCPRKVSLLFADFLGNTTEID